jgi:hypothetical protein
MRSVEPSLIGDLPTPSQQWQRPRQPWSRAYQGRDVIETAGAQPGPGRRNRDEDDARARDRTLTGTLRCSSQRRAEKRGKVAPAAFLVRKQPGSKRPRVTTRDMNRRDAHRRVPDHGNAPRAIDAECRFAEGAPGRPGGATPAARARQQRVKEGRPEHAHHAIVTDFATGQPRRPSSCG